MADAGLIQISLVALTTADPDRAIEFYVDRLGFEKRTDTPFGNGYRWIEVYPPSGAAGIALAPPPEANASAGGKNTGITLTTDDIEATHAALAAAGVDVDPGIARMGDPVPPMFWLGDPDENVLLVVENAGD